MELVYLRYVPKNTLFLLLKLGERGGKLCGLLSTKVPDNERANVLKSRHILSNMSLDRQIRWIRDNCPISYRLAYREVTHANTVIISKHALK